MRKESKLQRAMRRAKQPKDRYLQNTIKDHYYNPIDFPIPQFRGSWYTNPEFEIIGEPYEITRLNTLYIPTDKGVITANLDVRTWDAFRDFSTEQVIGAKVRYDSSTQRFVYVKAPN